jgi:hypothetical protein
MVTAAAADEVHAPGRHEPLVVAAVALRVGLA